MSEKKKILILIDWFAPAFKAGGPIKSVLNIVNSLSHYFDFFIITSDRDLNEKGPLDSIELNNWIKKENYNIIYLAPEVRDKWIREHLSHNTYDAVYFNSLFSRCYTLKPLLLLNKLRKQKILLAPRGMLGQGALSIKPLKKKLFLSYAKLFGYYKTVIWHATNEEEKNDIIKVFGKKSTIKIASNISICKIEERVILKKENELNIVFFSRISPKKNLEYLLNILEGLTNITLDIYGSIEDKNYWNNCNEIIRKYNLNVNFKGEVNPVNVVKTLSSYHFFVLPTQHENYGHVIVEALTAGCGLIISDNTPWRNLETEKIGWDISLSNQEKFKSVLKQCISMDQEEYNRIRYNCYNFVTEKINTNEEIENTKQLFN